MRGRKHYTTNFRTAQAAGKIHFRAKKRRGKSVTLSCDREKALWI
jgi:hypothetical protein